MKSPLAISDWISTRFNCGIETMRTVDHNPQSPIGNGQSPEEKETIPFGGSRDLNAHSSDGRYNLRRHLFLSIKQSGRP
jgi:hypothetical protein